MKFGNLQHSAGFNFEDGEGHLQLVDCLPNFRMLTQFVLEDLQQAMSSGDMFYRLTRIGVWFLVFGFHVTYLCRYFSPCAALAHLAGNLLATATQIEGSNAEASREPVATIASIFSTC